VTADAIVVGAGIVGAACAWRLAERGLRVVVLEREAAPATGSTGRSAAGVRHQFSDEVNVRLSMASIEEYRAMPAAAYRPIGYLFYVPHALWEAHLHGVRTQRALGVAVQTLTPQEAARRVPVDATGLAGATFCAADGFVDPHGICMEYVGRARALGARVELGAEVTAIGRAGAGWAATAGGRVFEAPLLVNAAGAWSGRVAALAGLRVPVGPARRMVFTTGPLPEALARHHPFPLTVDLGSGFWFRSERDRLIFGLSNPADTGFSEGIDWEWLETTYEAALAHFPWFEQLAVDRRASWWGYYEVTPDHNPVIGRHPGADGWIDACGFSGHGVQQAAAVGRIVAQEACGEAPFVDVDALRITRFTAAGTAEVGGERLIV
jgi:sarcosine oxidase subunit beta